MSEVEYPPIPANNPLPSESKMETTTSKPIDWAAVLAGLCLATILIAAFVFWQFGPARFADRCAQGYAYKSVNPDVLCPS